MSKDAAKDVLVAATNESPADLETWRALIEFYIRVNRFDDAVAACDLALTKLPNNDEVTTLKAQAMVLKSTTAGDSDLRPLIDALSKDPANAPQVEMLARSRMRGRLSNPRSRSSPSSRRWRISIPSSIRCSRSWCRRISRSARRTMLQPRLTLDGRPPK